MGPFVGDWNQTPAGLPVSQCNNQEPHLWTDGAQCGQRDPWLIKTPGRGGRGGRNRSSCLMERSVGVETRFGFFSRKIRRPRVTACGITLPFVVSTPNHPPPLWGGVAPGRGAGGGACGGGTASRRRGCTAACWRTRTGGPGGPAAALTPGPVRIGRDRLLGRQTDSSRPSPRRTIIANVDLRVATPQAPTPPPCPTHRCSNWQGGAVRHRVQ